MTHKKKTVKQRSGDREFQAKEIARSQALFDLFKKRKIASVSEAYRKKEKKEKKTWYELKWENEVKSRP